MIISTRFKRSLWGLLLIFCLGLLASPADSYAQLDQGPATPAADLPVREVRDTVPFGKDDARFGRISERPADIIDGPATPIQVRLLATKAPKVGEVINLALEIYSAEEAPATQAELVLPDGAELLGGSIKAKVDLAANERAKLMATIRFNGEGEYTLEGRAAHVVNQDMVWGDSDRLYFTVGRQAGAVGHRSVGRPQLTAQQASPVLNDQEQPGSQAEPPRDEHANAEDLPKHDPKQEPKENGPKEQPQPGNDSIGAQAQVSISICWTLGSDRDGSKPALRDAYIQLWDQDSGRDDLLARGHTGYYNGCRTFYVDHLDSDECCTIDVYFKVYTLSAGRWRVQNFGGGAYHCKTNTTWNVHDNVNYGTWWCGGTGGGNDGSVLIHNDLYRLHRFIWEHAVRLGGGRYPGTVYVQWEPDSNDGTYYSRSDGKVHLEGEDVDSRDTVVHEAGHRLMDLMYSGWPPSDCPSPHYINRDSGKGCAWSEGYTYVLVAGADGNPTYTWPSGSSINLETPRCNSYGWDDGPDVEGRVGGLLIDMLDPFTLSFDSVNGFDDEGANDSCYGSDTASGLFNEIWDTLYDQDDDVVVTQGGNSNSFSNAWESRGYPEGDAHYAGHHNTITTFTHD